MVTVHDAYGAWRWRAGNGRLDLDGWPWKSRHDRPGLRPRNWPLKRCAARRMAALAARCAGTLAYVSEAARIQFEAEHEIGAGVASAVMRGVGLPEAAATRPAWLPERPFLLAMSRFADNKSFGALPGCMAHLPDDWLLALAGRSDNRCGREAMARSPSAWSSAGRCCRAACPTARSSGCWPTASRSRCRR